MKIYESKQLNEKHSLFQYDKSSKVNIEKLINEKKIKPVYGNKDNDLFYNMELETKMSISELIHFIDHTIYMINFAHQETIIPFKENEKSLTEGVLTILNTKNYSPEISHKKWCESKIKDGWVYGTKKDLEKKTHPCLVEYDKLPEYQKAKDYIFMGMVNAYKDLLEYDKNME